MELVGGGRPVNPIHDFGWYKRHLYIQERLTHEFVRLEPTLIQKAVRRAILDSEAAAKAARLIILKARREGVSTITQGTFAHRAFTRKNVKSYTIAHEMDAASILFGMTESMYANLPEALKPGRIGGNFGRRLRLDNGADLRTETAKDIRAGRASAATLLHCSEVAFWDHGDEVLRSMLSIVPNVPGTIIVMESTANGVGGTFHKRWLSAAAGRSDYTPLFFSWLRDPIYFQYNQTWDTIGPLDDEEETLRVTLDASPGQLAWRRYVIRTEMDGDLDGFHQEYPSTPEEAFITSGRQFFGAGSINRFHSVEPIARTRITGDWVKGQYVKAIRDEKGPLWVYETSQKDHRYVMFIDPAGIVAEKRARSFDDPSDVSDYTVMWIVDCTTFNTVAVWHGRIDLGEAGEVAAKLGKIYNNAVICPETTGGYGFVIVEKLRDLGYKAIHRDHNRATYGRERSARYGWDTTVATRPTMLETLRDVLRENPEKLRHHPLKAEMYSFIIGNTRAEAAPGTHDDLVMAAAGAYTIADEYAQRRPLTVASMTQKKAKRRPKRFEDTLMRARR